MTLRALIIDDNANFLATARRVLEREGITVVGVASCGAEGLSLSQEHDPDVILVDVDLGQENGFEVAERLGAATGNQRSQVVLISAYPAEDLEDLLQTSSAAGFVSKSQLSARAIIDVLDRDGR